jgi:hypothetical protein
LSSPTGKLIASRSNLREKLRNYDRRRKEILDAIAAIDQELAGITRRREAT